jgi:hypothetical protein
VPIEEEEEEVGFITKKQKLLLLLFFIICYYFFNFELLAVLVLPCPSPFIQLLLLFILFMLPL